MSALRDSLEKGRYWLKKEREREREEEKLSNSIDPWSRIDFDLPEYGFSPNLYPKV